MELPALRIEAVEATRDAIADALRHRANAPGFFRATGPRGQAFLFFHETVAWCAGEADADGPMAMSVASFFERLSSATSVVVCDVDLPLFLCAAVVFRKPPAMHVPTAFVDADQLLKTLASVGKDAVLAMRKRDAWALAFCRNGEPVALYGSPGLPVGGHGTITERVLELIYATKDVVIDLYDEIRVPRASDAGQTADQLRGMLDAERAKPILVVTLGDRVVFRHRIDREETVVGRGLDVQLALDNLSVSRRHASIKVRDDRLFVEDLGSENGIVVHGQRVAAVELRPGDAVVLGKYTLTHASYVADDVAAADHRRVALSADMETVNISQRRTAVLEHAGTRHKLRSLVFTIGKGRDANLRIRGLLVGSVHAVIEPGVDGGYVLRRVERGRALRVNGTTVDKQALQSGDEIVVAGERMRFLLL